MPRFHQPRVERREKVAKRSVPRNKRRQNLVLNTKDASFQFISCVTGNKGRCFVMKAGQQTAQKSPATEPRNVLRVSVQSSTNELKKLLRDCSGRSHVYEKGAFAIDIDGVANRHGRREIAEDCRLVVKVDVPSSRRFAGRVRAPKGRMHFSPIGEPKPDNSIQLFVDKKFLSEDEEGAIVKKRVGYFPSPFHSNETGGSDMDATPLLAGVFSHQIAAIGRHEDAFGRPSPGLNDRRAQVMEADYWLSEQEAFAERVIVYFDSWQKDKLTRTVVFVGETAREAILKKCELQSTHRQIRFKSRYVEAIDAGVDMPRLEGL